MNPEIKAQWVAALRSGAYRQGRECLRGNDDTFCCLGVLCDLHSKATGGAWVRYECQYYLGNKLVLPYEVAEWAFDASVPRELGNTAGRNPIVHANGKADNISTLNDEGLTFAELANIIEAQL